MKETRTIKRGFNAFICLMCIMLSTPLTAQEILGKNVYSTTGVKIYDNIISKEQGELEINTQQWANGIYFFTITTKIEIVKGKFVINH